jgi:hypothetical protein
LNFDSRVFFFYLFAFHFGVTCLLQGDAIFYVLLILAEPESNSVLAEALILSEVGVPIAADIN